MVKSSSISVFEPFVQSEKTLEPFVQSEKTLEPCLFNLDKFAKHCKPSMGSIFLEFESNDLKEKIDDYVILFNARGNGPHYI